MSKSNGWKALANVPANTPKLLVKSSFTASGYEVQLTDLSRIWAESLCKRDIIRRAWSRDCSIDPAESDGQFQIFLDKIEGALSGADGTTLKLLPNGEDALSMELESPLPKPFKPLTWTLSLERWPEGALTESMVTPLLHQAGSLKTQIAHLLNELREKDRVIAKITDRLETSGNDLTTVFPGVSNIKTNTKKPQREQLAKHVRGLGDFDKGAWHARVESINADRDGLWSKVNSVFDDLPQLGDDASETTEHEKWWQHLETIANVNRESEAQAAAKQTPSKGERAPEDESMVEDEFQRQGTPEHLRERDSGHHPSSDTIEEAEDVSRSAPPADDGDSTTEDEGDLDVVSFSEPPAIHHKLQASPPDMRSHNSPQKKLEKLGGRSAKPSPSPLPANVQTPENDYKSAAPPAKLGGLGGKAKVSQSTATNDTDVVKTDAEPRKSTKMGVIGGKKAQTTTTPMSPDATPSPAMKDESPARATRAQTKEATPPPRETSQERADRKRDELKRDLARKSQAPAKKKRKF